MLHQEITDRVIGAFYNVFNTLGHGFLEKVYENALVIELKKAGLSVQQQEDVVVYYKNQPVGKYTADLIVNEVVILELKAVQAINIEHHAQLRNYLKATGKRVGLLLNFGPKPEFKRMVLGPES